MKNHSQNELKRMAMIDLANLLMIDKKKALDFHEAFDKIAEIKGFSNSEKQEQLNQFYTDLNVDGRFMTIGSNVWGLKRWYPVDQIDDEVAAAPSKKKKKKGKTDDDDDFGFDDEEEDLDLVAGFDDEDEEDEEEVEVEEIKDKNYANDDEDDEAQVFAEGFDIIDTDEDEDDDEEEDDEEYEEK